MTYREALEVPPEMTQEGLASAAWVELRHLSQYLRPLLGEELVRERTCHVKGIRQRRKVYHLTDAGMHTAYRLRDRVRAETVRVRDASGTHDETVAKVLEALGGKVPLLRVLRRSSQDGAVDLETLLAAPASSLVVEMREAPQLERFVGRDAELAQLTALDTGPRVFVVRGVAGIGKSSVAAKACDMLRGRCNLFWHTLRPWDTPVSVLTALGEFLSVVGKPGLRANVASGEAGNAAEVLRQDLPGTRCFLVFDDAHDAGPEVVALLRFLKEAMADAPDCRALVLTRRAIGFYDRRDVSIRKLVGEIDLGGLRQEDVSAFLESGADEMDTALVRSLGGHPLFLQLVHALPRAPAHESALRDMRHFLEEEIYGELTDAERIALKAASLYRVPAPPTALLAHPAITHDTLLSLTNRSLLRTVGTDRLEVHDTLRRFFADILTPSELAALGGYAATQLRSLASRARGAGDDVGALDFLSNALSLPGTPEEREDLFETLADIHEKIGDLPAALTEYKEADKIAATPEARARLHRKIASAFETRGQLPSATEELASSRRALGDAESPERPWIDLVASRLALSKGDFGESRAAGERALTGFRSRGDRQGEMRACLAMGNVEFEDPQGDPLGAEHHYQAGVRLAQDLGEAEREVRLRIALAHLYANRVGDLTRTIEEFRAIESHADALRDPQTQRSFLMLQAWIALEIRADFPEAVRLFNEAAALARKIHFVSSLPATRYGLALAAYYQGRLEDARTELEAFAGESEELGLQGWVVEALSVLAECDLRRGDIKGFRDVVRSVARPLLAPGRDAHPVRAKLVEAVDHASRNEVDQARTAFDRALQTAAQGQPVEQALELHFVHFYWGIMLGVSGERRESEEHLRMSREYLEKAHLKARLSILPEAQRELEETFARVLTAPRD